MKKFFGIALFILVLVVMAACNNKEPANQANAPVAKQGDGVDKTSSVSGSEVFQKSCITCHSSGGITGGQININGARIHSDFKTKDDLLSFVSQNMPKSAPGSLTKEEYDAVVQYLWEQK